LNQELSSYALSLTMQSDYEIWWVGGGGGADAVVPVGLKFSVGASQLGDASSNHD
jgi:hypothetical protein